MSASIFPLVFASEEFRLVAGIALGFLFGFSLERAGFGNARKLAAQFYGYDLTVFKVMFTAILVAMVGIYAMANFGWVDMSLIWINPTFMWAQLVGGFLLGAGFIMSGLCPGTSVVSAASGRWDAVVTLGGIFLGTLLFALFVDWVPALESLYHAGDMGVSLLPDLLGVPPLVLTLAVVAVAAIAFIVAERIEARLQGRREPLALAPRPRPRVKLATAGVLAIGATLGLGATWLPAPEPVSPPIAATGALDLAERIIAGDPTLMILDLRGDDPDERVPGAYPAPDADAALALLQSAPAGTRVVVYDASGRRVAADAGWPARISYQYLEGGFDSWRSLVLDGAVELESGDPGTAARIAQISAYFSGAAVQSSGSAPPPPPMPAGGGAAKKKAGGC